MDGKAGFLQDKDGNNSSTRLMAFLCALTVTGVTWAYVLTVLYVSISTDDTPTFSATLAAALAPVIGLGGGMFVYGKHGESAQGPAA